MCLKHGKTVPGSWVKERVNLGSISSFSQSGRNWRIMQLSFSRFLFGAKIKLMLWKEHNRSPKNTIFIIFTVFRNPYDSLSFIKVEFRKNTVGALFRIMKVNANWSSQASTFQKSTIKYHKSVPYDPCAIFQVIWWWLCERNTRKFNSLLTLVLLCMFKRFPICKQMTLSN